MTWAPYPDFVNPGDNAWQLTAATLVGLMSVPGLAVLYGGVMQKRWSVNAMMMSFVAFALVLVVWVLYGFKFAFGSPLHIFGAGSGSFFGNMWGTPAPVLGTGAEQAQAVAEDPARMALVQEPRGLSGKRSRSGRERSWCDCAQAVSLWVRFDVCARARRGAASALRQKGARGLGGGQCSSGDGRAR